MRGIPVSPVDGQQYSGLFAGWPSVLEYDQTTGGFKLIVDAEIGEAIQISGSIDINAADIAAMAGAQYAEDSPHTSGNTGTFVLGVRQDAPVSMVNAEGDYTSFITDVLGRLHVFTSGSFVQTVGTALASISNWQLNAQYAEDEMFVGGSTGTFVLAVRTDTMQSYASDDGDFSTLNTDIYGRLYTFTTGSYTNILNNVPVTQTNQFTPGQYVVSEIYNQFATGTFVLGIRQDAPSLYVDAEGDYTPLLTDVLGRLHVFTSGSHVTATLETADIEIGAVEIKDFATEDRQRVTADNRSWVSALITGTVDMHLLNPQINAQYPEDSVHVNGATGTFILGVRQDAPPATVVAEGNYSTLLTDIMGRLHVFTSGSYVHTLGTALVNQQIPAQYAEDSPHVSGATGTFTLGVRFDHPLPMAAEQDYTPFMTDVQGRVHVFTSGSYSGLVTGTALGIAGQTKGIQRGVVNISGSPVTGGEFELVAAVGALRIKVTSLMIVPDATTHVHLQSGFSGTPITGPMLIADDGAVGRPGFFLNTPSTTDQFHFQTEPGENLVIDLSGPAAIGGWIQYYTEA